MNSVGITTDILYVGPLFKGPKIIGHLAAQLFYGKVRVVTLLFFEFSNVGAVSTTSRASFSLIILREKAETSTADISRTRHTVKNVCGFYGEKLSNHDSKRQ